jgi:serine phosphatase RsbU (regulator of sigma subunit)
MLMKKFIILLFFSFSFFAKARVNDSLIFRIKPAHNKVREQYVSNGLSVSYTRIRLENNYYFLYKNKIDTSYTKKEYNDDQWTSMQCEDALGFEDNDHFNGQATFRLYYKFTDSTINTPVVCDLYHKGASAIYIDGKLIKNYGKLGTSKNDEKIIIPRFDPIYIQHNDTLQHTLTILYTNYSGLNNLRNHHNDVGIQFKILFFSDYEDDLSGTYLLHNFLIGLFAFFFALAIAHFFLYFADRSKRFNLFYALFLIMVSCTSIRPVISNYTESPGFLDLIDKISIYFIPLCLFFLLNLVYSFFNKKLNKFFYVQAIFFICFIIAHLLGFNTIAGLAYSSLFFSTYVGVTIIAIKAIRHKYNGGNYLGWGVLLFTIFFILGAVSTGIGEGGMLFYFFISAAILSLPISMTAYLSHDFATTSRSLKQQLAANEALSQKTIQQEKEKQEMLSDQNKILETQVNERTKEIATQNKVLEQQKKEITDSINYSKRIQQSMLPPLEEIYASLTEAFVLFRPKDIVSGDFYWFHKSTEEIFIAAADCTGHGVPGAIMSMLGTEKLNEAAGQTNDVSMILSLVNKGVKKSLRQSESENSTRDGMDIAICSFNTSMTELNYSGANRPIWIIRSGTTSIEEIKATKTAIGGTTDDNQVFEKHQITLQKGDTIYIFSDGYADQFSPENKKLMTRKFKEIILSIQNLNIADQRDHLDDFMTKWKGNMEQTDDIMVIGVRV